MTDEKRKPATTFYSAIFEHQDALTRADILTYYAIGDLGDFTHCAAYQDEIAALAGGSVRQCQRSITQLVEWGY